MSDKDLMNCVSVISFVVVLLFLFFAFFLLTVKTNNKTRNGLLASFLIITAIDISVFFYYRYITLPPGIEMLRARCISFLKDPLLYLYLLSLVYTDFRLKAKHFILALPFLLSIAVLLPGFFMAGETTQRYFFQHFNEMPEMKFLKIAEVIQSAAYTVAMILLLRKYRTLLLENYASNISQSNYKWLSQLITVIIMLSAITQAKDIFKRTAYTDIANGLTIIMLAGGVIFIFWIVLNALHYPDLFRGIDAKLQPVEKLVAETERITTETESPDAGTASVHTGNSEVKTAADLENIQRLKEYLALEEPYLEPSLTIQDLASQMKMPVKDLSILINHKLGQHFFDLINDYRIEKAMDILKDPKKADLTVLEVLYQVGFNSKSSFNTSFKKYTDLTPTQYRKTYS